MADGGQRFLSISQPAVGQYVLDPSQRRADVDGLGGGHALGPSEWLRSDDKLQRPSHRFHGAVALYPSLCRGSFLSRSPPYSLATALSDSAQAAPSEHEPRPLVRSLDAPRRTLLVFLGRATSLDHSVAPNSRNLPLATPRLRTGGRTQRLRPGEAADRGMARRGALHPLLASQTFRSELRRRPGSLRSNFRHLP